MSVTIDFMKAIHLSFCYMASKKPGLYLLFGLKTQFDSFACIGFLFLLSS